MPSGVSYPAAPLVLLQPLCFTLPYLCTITLTVLHHSTCPYVQTHDHYLPSSTPVAPKFIRPRCGLSSGPVRPTTSLPSRCRISVPSPRPTCRMTLARLQWPAQTTGVVLRRFPPKPSDERCEQLATTLVLLHPYSHHNHDHYNDFCGLSGRVHPLAVRQAQHYYSSAWLDRSAK